MLLKDGIMYYVVICGVNLINVLVYLVSLCGWTEFHNLFMLLYFSRPL